MKEVTLSSNKNSAGWLANLSLEWRWAPGSQNECFWLWGHPILDTPASSWLLFLFPPWREDTVLCFPTTFWQEAVLRKPDPMAVSRNVSSPLTHPQKLTHSSVLFCLPFCYILEYSWLRASHVSVGKESTCNAGDAGDMGSVLGVGRSPGGGHGNPLQYSCLENPMDRGAWQTTVHGVAEGRTWLKQLRMHTSSWLTMLSQFGD